MADDIHVTGLAELQAFLDALPVKIERNIMRSALRAGANVIKPIAASNIRSVSGTLAKSLKVGTRARSGTVTANVRTKVFYAKFVEYGTRPHTIAAKDGGALMFGNGFHRSVQHPGTTPRPFMRPALDSQAQAAVIAVGEQIKARLTKGGIDATDVLVEGDEP